MKDNNIFSESGIIITLVLIAIPVLTAAAIMLMKAYAAFNDYLKREELKIQ